MRIVFQTRFVSLYPRPTLLGGDFVYWNLIKGLLIIRKNLSWIGVLEKDMMKFFFEIKRKKIGKFSWLAKG